MEEWYFDCERGQFWLVTRQDVKGLIKFYVLSSAEPRQKQGRLNQTPTIDVVDTFPSGAYLEWHSAVPYYYMGIQGT